MKVGIKMFGLQLCAFLLCCCVIISSSTPTPFDAKEFFIGDWEVELQQSSMKLFEKGLSVVNTVSYRILSANETLTGTYMNEKDESRPLKITFTSTTAGQFLIGSPLNEEEIFDEVEDDDNELKLHFEFDFNNSTIGYTSQGHWRDEHKGESGSYQMIVTSPIAFIMNIFVTLKQNTEDKEVISTSTSDTPITITTIYTLFGKKEAEKPPPSFFQKYGMMIMFGVLMLTQFMQRRGAQTPIVPTGAPQVVQENNEDEGNDEGNDEGDDNGDEGNDEGGDDDEDKKEQ